MNVSKFIDRPVLSMVISVLIVLVGVISLFLLPIEQYPDVTPPAVRIRAVYPGANAKTVTEAVATPIEQELNGAPNMIYMESKNTNNGGMTIMATFAVGSDPDLAAVEIQNRIKLAEARLPIDVVQNGIEIEKVSPNQLMTVSLISDDPRYDEVYLSNFTSINVLDVLRRTPGVGRVVNVGKRNYAMRIWVNPHLIASYGLTIKNITDAIKDQNRESAVGALGILPNKGNIDITLPITSQGRLSTTEQFGNIIIRTADDGSVIRIRDVARVELGASAYRDASSLNNGNAAMMDVFLLPGANAMEVSKYIKEKMKELSKSFPDGLDYVYSYDATQFIEASINEVYQTLFEAIFLVILVVYLSLQSWRAALVPTIAVPISLVGTFAVMLAFGFSLNTLTLLGLILAIGIVVDDAIVVVESVEQIMEEQKIGAREATHIAMKGLSGALIATSMVLAAVFIPVSFLAGITGELFRQFSVTIAVSVLISTIVALTLSPALCAIIMKPRTGKKNWLFRAIDQGLEYGNSKYTGLVKATINNHRRTLACFGVLIVLTAFIIKIVPSSFLPEEDQGWFTVEMELQEGTAFPRMSKVMDKANDFLLTLPEIEYVQSLKGRSNRIGGSEARGVLTVVLKQWEERSELRSLNEIIDVVRAEFQKYPEAIANISKPPVIPGLGTGGGFEFQLQDRSGGNFQNLMAASDTMMYYVRQSPMLQDVSTNLLPEIPMLYFDLDRDRARFLGIPLGEIFTTMKALLGSVYINDFNLFNRIYRVFLQADENYRLRPSDLNNFYVKADNGTMVPLSALGKAELSTGPGTITRFNLFNTSTFVGVPAAGYSSGQAMDELEDIADKHLPEGIGYEWSGVSYQEKQSAGQTGPIMLVVLLFVFLFLAAQYESWIIPIAVLLSMPVAVFGAFLGVWMRGLENDVYFQIGLVALIGLAAKNAILIVEFAKEKYESGSTLTEAALSAASLRFRPIVMTSLAFILGMIPLVTATGAGSASRHSIGTGVFAGMLVATSLGIVFVPLFYVVIGKMKEKWNKKLGKENTTK
ncbi:efflux RND transporter permease subunit [Sediminitomix flava]|uniref:Hydrophobe/amphiphile efflux-1 (HAE1) family protein n=1 Tax=Sediminitomix flava TaxID=379075 RepID=A0A315Z7H8_SEDFL|nr:multidrug efflux RND transporter permease subunit [Sediminitomix flava]PWJ39160.1 hydrophobe/amphiphile efflux-1 (HAE1) family protein [Sediminitomix flava]